MADRNQHSPAPDPQLEKRIATADDLELRLVDAEDGKPARMVGYAARFNKKSVDLGGFVEVVKPGAFKASLAEDDVRGLFNHDPSKLLGRTGAGTLRLAENKLGLRFEIDVPDTQVGRDVAEHVRRGDIDGASFSFQTISDKWTYSKDGKDALRELHEVRLFDIGPVTFPAYPDTSVAVRSLEAHKSETTPPGPPAEPNPEDAPTEPTEPTEPAEPTEPDGPRLDTDRLRAMRRQTKIEHTIMDPVLKRSPTARHKASRGRGLKRRK